MSETRLILTCGLPGAGKTTLATRLAAERNAIRLTKDEWQWALGSSPWDRHTGEKIEQLLWQLAQDLLRRGVSVVLDFGLWARLERDEMRTVARDLGVGVELHYLEVPADELWRRIDVRNSVPPWDTEPIRRDDLDQWLAIFQAPNAEELALFDPLPTTKSEPIPADVETASGERPSATLSDGVVVLRPWSRADAAFMYEASRDPAIERFNGPAPDSLANAISVIERIEECWRSFEVDGDPTGAAFAIVDAASGEPAGMCGIDNWLSTDVAQFGYWLAAGARGRGFATRAVILMTTWLFELGAARVFLTIQSENTASAAVARRAGFEFEGTLRAYGVWRGHRQDVHMFAVLPDGWPSERMSERSR